MRAKNLGATYSRKRKTSGKTKTYITNNIINYSVNITNNIFVQGNQTKPESSNSESGDTFDKLLKGPTYNARHQLSPGLSGNSSKFLSKRQDTVVLYKSDADLSAPSDVSSLPLFKDSKDFDLYTPSWSPVQYCMIKKKLVKQEKLVKKTQTLISYKKNPNRIEKKCRVSRKNKPLTKVKCEPYTSSTPTRSITIPNEVFSPVSPIMPAQYFFNRDIYPEDVFAAGGSKNVPKQNSMLGVSALIKGLGNLGIKTPHHKKSTGMINCVKKEPELFGSENPPKVPIYCQSEKLERNDFQKSDPDTPIMKFKNREKNVRMNCLQTDSNNSPCFLTRKKIIGSDWFISRNSQFNTKQEIFEREDSAQGSEPGQHDSKSSSPQLKNDNNQQFEQEILISSSVSSSSSSVHREKRHSSVNNEENLSPVIMGINKTNSRNSSLGSCKAMNHFDSNSDSMHKSGKFEGKNSKSFNYNDYTCSPPFEDNANLYRLQNSNNFLKMEGEENKSKYCTDLVVSCLNNSQCKKSPVEESKVKVIEEDKESQRFQNNAGDGCLNETNHEKSPEEVLKGHGLEPFSNPSNVAVDTSSCENTSEIYKLSFHHCKENKNPEELNTKRKSSFQQLVLDQNETLVTVNLEAGKKWRRSLLRQKQPDSKLDRRLSMAADTLYRLIKESSILSGVSNDTKLSCNITTRHANSFLDQELRNNSPPISRGSPSFNLTFSKLSKIQIRRKRNYICDMNEIPEENSGHSSKLCNEEVCTKESVLEANENSFVECESLNVTSLDQTNTYGTPPIMKLNDEALSAITDRKRSRGYRPPRSLGNCSMFNDDDENETSVEENNLFTSCLSKLNFEDDDLAAINEEDIQQMGRVGFLLQCGQEGPILFSEAFPEQALDNAQKIGEGVFGEVFMIERPEGRSVIKIIPVEGSQKVNGEPQKRFDEVLSELIITEQLCLLRQNNWNCTSGFCELKGKFFLEGRYPSKFLTLWHEFDAKKRSDNECPDMFGSDQLYLVLELAHAGEPVESFSFKSPQEALGIFLQTTSALAVAESATEFEHRDLHIGNVLVQKTSLKYIPYVLDGNSFECPTYGAMATIIDYTLSRISFKGEVLFLDLENDPELFTAEGDYQFEVYRLMRQDLNHNWHDHRPKTNIRWLHYLIGKLKVFKYKQKKTAKVYREFMGKIEHLEAIILDFYSAADFAKHLIETYCETRSLIRS